MGRPDYLKDCLLGSPADNLLKGAQTFIERNKLYGDNYRNFGPLMMALFPKGSPENMNADDWNRLGLIVMCVSKLTRYAEQFQNGGHRDSAHDLCVYAAMLESETNEK